MGKHKFNGNPNNLLKCRKKYLIGITIWVAFFLGYSSILTIRSCKTQAKPILYITVITFVRAKPAIIITISCIVKKLPILTRFLYLLPLDDKSSGNWSVLIDSKTNVPLVTNRPKYATVVRLSLLPILAFLFNEIPENR